MKNFRIFQLGLYYDKQNKIHRQTKLMKKEILLF